MFDSHLLLPVLAMLSLAAATLVSEDLTCIGAGVLVAEGSLSISVAIAGCFIGIVGGDILLMLGGRWLGHVGLRAPFVRRFVTAEVLDESIQWMRERGAIAVALSRFVPGTRLATYVTAGALGIGFWRFAISVSVTALVWVPAVVAASALAGATIVQAGLSAASTWVAVAAVSSMAIGAAVRIPKRFSAWRICRQFLGLWRRWTRWEFWPMWALYMPLTPYLIGLALKHRSLTLFTAANPDIPAGGFIGESKFDILRNLAASGQRVARYVLVPAEAPLARRTDIVQGFMDRTRLTYPIVLKPDRGQRGSGVTVLRSEGELQDRLAAASADMIAQEYVEGVEFGVFYYRRPSESRGHIFSITDKRFPTVTGDGCSTLESLILADERAVCLAALHRRVHRAQLSRIPARGEVVPLVEIGSHCRGALFLDAGHLITPVLEQAVDEVAQRFGGFYFGRFDVRAPSVEALTARGEFRILELNGVTSEATHIYDPRHGAGNAYRVLASQWRLAFEIGADNRRRGVRPTSIIELVRLMLEYRRHRQPTPETGNRRLHQQVAA